MELIPIGRKIIYHEVEHEVCGYAYLGERYYFLKDEHGTVSLLPEVSVYNMIVEIENELNN